MRSARFWTGILFLSVACGDSTPKRGHELEPKPDASDTARDAASDASGNDAGTDAAVDSDDDFQGPVCEDDAHEKTIQNFVAAHRACTSNSECAVVGSCENSKYVAVASSAKEEVQALLDERSCKELNGSGYEPVCFDGACQKLGAVYPCFGPVDGIIGPLGIPCPQGTHFRKGCSAEADFAAGCYHTCEGQKACPDGYVCQQLQANNCDQYGNGDTCDQCGEASLCMPEPECDVLTFVEFHQNARSAWLLSEVAEIKLVIENLRNESRTLEYLEPCHGPYLPGLAGYDLWNGCVRGDCAAVETWVPLTLGPRERRVMYISQASPLPSTCNPEGLPKGRYNLSWNFPGVTGSKVCSLPPSELRVGK